MSHDSQVATLPYESCSLATPLCGGTTTRAMFSATYEIVVSRALFCHRLRGKSHEAGKGERFSLARRAVCLFSPVESPVVKVFFILRPQGATKTL